MMSTAPSATHPSTGTPAAPTGLLQALQRQAGRVLRGGTRRLLRWAGLGPPVLRYEDWIRDRLAARLIDYPPVSPEVSFSLLTPVFNTPPRFLKALAESVFGQDYGTFEWVVVDNGSTRWGTQRVLRRLDRDPRVRLVRLDANQGILRGTHAALLQATGDYAVPVDHDDLLAPDALRVLANFIRDRGEPAILYSDEDKLLNGRDHYALVLGSDTMSRTVSRQDRNTAIMFADGAGAVLLGTQAPGRIRSSWLRTKYSGTVQLDTEFKRGHEFNPDERIPKSFIYQEAKSVLRVAPQVMHEALMEALKLAGLTVSELDYLITHQANQRMVRKVAEMAQIDISKVHMSGERYGNTSAATHPVALDELSQAGKIRRGSLVGLTSFGAGLTWGACILEW